MQEWLKCRSRDRKIKIKSFFSPCVRMVKTRRSAAHISEEAVCVSVFATCVHTFFFNGINKNYFNCRATRENTHTVKSNDSSSHKFHRLCLAKNKYISLAKKKRATSIFMEDFCERVLFTYFICVVCARWCKWVRFLSDVGLFVVLNPHSCTMHAMCSHY